ncbi:hypothetical protein [Myroides odoratus]|uniref:hypothetical protein n=1 Tax=Myroides odoratus TaxID=256 RepID=UPI0039AFF867
MKNITRYLLLLIFIVFTSGYGQSVKQSQNYDQALIQIVKELANSKSEDAYDKVFYKLERLNQMKDGKDWILLYHMAYCKTVVAQTKKSSEAKMDLDDAMNYLQQASEITSDSEIFTLLSRVYIALIGLSPLENGPKYTASVTYNLEKAIKLNKNNPRVYLVYGMYYVHFPKFIGGDVEKGCKSFAEAVSLYDKMKLEPASTKPNWGKELNEWYLSTQCPK